MSGTTRAQFLARGAKGGMALVAGGLVLGVAEGTALGAISSDADISKDTVLFMEILSIHVSRRLQPSKILPLGENQVLVVAGVRPDEQIDSDEDSQFFDHWLATGGRLIVARCSHCPFT